MFINKPLCFRVLVERHSICGWLWALLTLYPETLQLIAFLSLAQALFFVSILSRVWFTYLQRNYVNVCCFLFFVDVSLAPPPPTRYRALGITVRCFTSLHFSGDESAQADPGQGPPFPLQRWKRLWGRLRTGLRPLVREAGRVRLSDKTPQP